MLTSLADYFLNNCFEWLNLAWQFECYMAVCFSQLGS